MTWSMDYLRRLCRMFEVAGNAETVRVFFPDNKELQLAVDGNGESPPRFGGVPFKMDFLTKPTGFLDIGLDIGKVDVVQRVQSSDRIIVIAYPSFNVNEMLCVEELWKGSVEGTDRSIVVFNGELDRIRSGYYPSLFYPKIGGLAKTFLPLFTQAYYIHNFKGSRPGTLFRCYPGPWQVLRRCSQSIEVVKVLDEPPSLREVQMEILPT